MTHDEAYAELDAVAFDLLDPKEHAAVMAHVDQCSVCRSELDARRALVADLAFAAPLSTDTPGGRRGKIRDRLTARARSEKVGDVLAPAEAKPPAPPRTSGASRDATPHVVHSRRTPSRVPVAQPTPSTPLLVPTDSQSRPASHRRRFGAAGWTAMAAGLLLVAAGGLLAITMRERDQLQATLRFENAQTESARHVADSLRAVVAARDSVLAGLGGREIVTLTLTSSEAREPHARMFWDRAHGRWTMIAHDLPELPAGRAYQLWLVTKSAKISVGTFVPRNGAALVTAELPLTEPLSAVTVTDEPAAGVEQPTGPVIISANAR